MMYLFMERVLKVCMRTCVECTCVLVCCCQAYLRVIQVYIRQWTAVGKSESHERRNQLVQHAVEVLLNKQFQPKGSGPFLGNQENAVKAALPILEKALVMPLKQASVGSEVTLCLFVCLLYVFLLTCSSCMCACRSGSLKEQRTRI